jgi:Mycoplasma protein of unknown function, DUF285
MFHLAGMFMGGDLTQWNVNRVESMASMFREASVFNGNVTTWDTRNLRTMSYMVRAI